MQPSYGLPSGYKLKQVPQFTPEMSNLFDLLLGKSMGGAEGGLDFLSKLAQGDESMFEQLEAPAYSALQRGLGETATRFSKIGAQDSSGFENMLAGQSSDLAEKLQSQRLGLRQGATKDLLGLSQNLLGQRPYENILQKKQSGFGGQAGGEALMAALKALPQLLALL
jgi:hypothetical protein